MKYNPIYHSDHEYVHGDYLWHFMTYDRNGNAFCLDITRMEGIVFGIGFYNPHHHWGMELISLADKASQQFDERRHRITLNP